MKGSDDVGLKLSVFENVKGGTLAFWSHDLVEKLGKRGYVLTGQSPAKSKNGVVGTRFDFEYVAPGTDGPKRFYTAVLFVTDKRRFVLQMAGHVEHVDKYLAQVDDIASDAKTRGCRPWTDICKGEQPGSLAKLADGTQLASSGPADRRRVRAPLLRNEVGDNRPGLVVDLRGDAIGPLDDLLAERA